MTKVSQTKILIISAVLSLAVIACGFSLNSSQVISQMTPVPAASPVAPTEPLAPANLALQPTQVSKPILTTNEEAILVEMYRRINPSVVNIITYTGENGFVAASGQGSGFVYDLEGNIVTNSHVVHGSVQIEVVFSDGLVEEAEIVGEDLHSDLAVINVKNLPPDSQPIPLGRIEEVAVGQTAVALGNPFGLGGTLTRGIISAMGRTIPALTSFSIPEAIQTDAPINPGNSGGPLLNLAGEVIGVNAQIETGGESRSNSGVGFAIPVSIIARVIPSLIANGEFQWSWLGVVGGNLNTAVKDAMKLPVERGAYISDVVSGGPADLAGLRGSSRDVTINNRMIEIGGDVIIAINGVQVNTFEDILIYIALNTTPNQNIELTIIRDGETQNVTLTLQPRPIQVSDFNLP